MRLKLHSDEKGLPAMQVPHFGEFSLEEQPGGTLKGTTLEKGKFEDVLMLYERIPGQEHGRISLRLERYSDSEHKQPLGNLRVTFHYSRKDSRWVFENWEGTLGKNVAPLEWEKMLNDFLSDKQAKKWLEGEETYGEPKKSFWRFGRG